MKRSMRLRGIGMRFETVRLGDVILFNPRETIKKGELSKKIDMSVLKPFTRDISSYEILEYKGGTKFRNGDTIMARITPCLENGKTAKISILDDNEVGFGSTEYIVFRAIEGVTDENFMYYLICSPIVREPAIKSMVGSSGRQRVQTNVLQNLEISLPILKIQQQIGSFLKSIDDKIALNTAINENLEQQAEALYKKFTSNSSEKQTIRTLDVFFNIFTGKKNSNASTTNGSFKFFTCSPEPLQIDSFIYDGNAIIVSGNGAYTGRTRFYSGKFDLYQRTYACTLKDNVNPDYIYPLYWFVKLELSKKIMGGTRGSAIPYIVMNDLAKFEFEFNERKFELFIPLFKTITEIIQANENENEKLSQLRDALLPKLMSGEINVSNIDL